MLVFGIIVGVLSILVLGLCTIVQEHKKTIEELKESIATLSNVYNENFSTLDQAIEVLHERLSIAEEDIAQSDTIIHLER